MVNMTYIIFKLPAKQKNINFESHFSSASAGWIAVGAALNPDKLN
jgi:hypothetical protein